MVEESYRPLRTSREGWDQISHKALEDVVVSTAVGSSSSVKQQRPWTVSSVSRDTMVQQLFDSRIEPVDAKTEFTRTSVLARTNRRPQKLVNVSPH